MTLRFTPAPGWPPVPEGWSPPAGWMPDPSWPPAPPGWKFWLPDGAAAPAGEPVATVVSSIELGHPADAFIYEACTPRISVDGVPVAGGWGRHPLPVTSADARLEIHVPYMGRRAGKASAVLPAGRPVHLAYMAPSVVFKKGAIGAQGEKLRSPGRRGVWVFNWVMLGLVAVGLVWVFATGGFSGT